MRLPTIEGTRARSVLRPTPCPAIGPIEPAPRLWTALLIYGPICLLTVTALVIRLYHLGARLVIFDEFLLLNPYTIDKVAAAYARNVWDNTTYNPCWAILVWCAQHMLGHSVFWARFPSCLAGAATVPAIFATARTIGLSRGAALVAASVMGMSVYHVEYGQQVIPYSAMPLGACLCILLTTLLARHDGRERPERAILVASGLLLVFGLMIASHNSALMVVPPVALYWIFSVSRHSGGPDGARRYQMAMAVFGGVAMAFAALAWLFAKLGDSDREYLWAFFPGTFHSASLRWFVSDTLNWTDGFYFAHRTAFGPMARPVDWVYFAVSRTFDFFTCQLRAEYLISNLHSGGLSAQKLPWVFTLPMLGLTVRGLIRSFWGRGLSEPRRWGISLGLTVVVCLALSSLRLYPLGGVRQLLTLSPFVALVAAAGFETTSHRARWLAVACGLTWVAGCLWILPDYYATTRDRIPPSIMKLLAQRHGVRDFVSGDNGASMGAVIMISRTDPAFAYLRADDVYMKRLIETRRPFFVCSLSAACFDPVPWAPVVTAQPIEPAILKHYTVKPLVIPQNPNGWFEWYVYLLEPKPGPRPPMVLEVTLHRREVFDHGHEPATSGPVSVFVEFNSAMRPEDFTTESVRLIPESRPGKFDRKHALPLQVGYAAGLKTLVVEPESPLSDGTRYLLVLSRKIREADGQRLNGDGPEYYQIVKRTW